MASYHMGGSATTLRAGDFGPVPRPSLGPIAWKISPGLFASDGGATAADASPLYLRARRPLGSLWLSSTKKNLDGNLAIERLKS